MWVPRTFNTRLLGSSTRMKGMKRIVKAMLNWKGTGQCHPVSSHGNLSHCGAKFSTGLASLQHERFQCWPGPKIMVMRGGNDRTEDTHHKVEEVQQRKDGQNLQVDFPPCYVRFFGRQRCRGGLIRQRSFLLVLELWGRRGLRLRHGGRR